MFLKSLPLKMERFYASLNCSMGNKRRSRTGCLERLQVNVSPAKDSSLTKREELSFLTVLAFPKASNKGLALMI